MLRKLRVPLLIGLTLGALAFVACSSDDDDSGGDATAAAAEATTADATATEAVDEGAEGAVATELNDSWQVIPEPGSIAAGSVTFAASNAGAQPHQLTIIETDLGPTDLPVEGGVVAESGDGFETVGTTDLIDGGASAEVTAELEAGSYVLICNVAGHYQLGMTTAFTVN